MIQRQSIRWALPVIVLTALVAPGPARFGGTITLAAAPQATASSATCDLEAYEKSEAEFNRLSALKRFNPDAVSDDALKAASGEFVLRGEACFQALYGDGANTHIDDGGLWYTEDGSQPYVMFGTKWGAGSSFPGGTNTPGPRIAGGTVTYSFMANGVDMTTESAGAGTNTAIASLPNAACGLTTDIVNALAAWSAVANIQFTQVADNGVPFNAAGATGDIRIGAHNLGGAGGTLAHGYYPPPNGTSAAGDIHFDSTDTWSCTTSGGFDIGIVAAHEIGHAIGLNHELTATALMNPFYNASIPGPIADDINGAQNIYGSAVAQAGKLIIDFGAAYGTFVLNYGVSWVQLHPLSPEEIVTGDLDANGVDEIIIDFGASYGVWVRLNNASWVQLHALSPVAMGVADMDNSGRKDVILSFATYGVFVWYNNTSFTQLHPVTATKIVAGQINGTGGEDVVLNFPGFGLWIRVNNASWVQLHVLNSTVLAVGNGGGAALDEVAVDFGAGYGLWVWVDNASWVQLQTISAARLAYGNIDADPREELLADFPGYGLYLLRNGTGWQAFHALSSEGAIIGDLDGNGRGEVVVDFGASYGMWIYANDSSWFQAHPVSPEGFAIADLTP
jgi:hypothetical protein